MARSVTTSGSMHHRKASVTKGKRSSLRLKSVLALTDERQLGDLAGVGPATLSDLALLGVHSVAVLSESDGRELYERLCSVTGVQHDICCLDVFRCAVAQARNPELPVEQRNWWYWSRLRKNKMPVWQKGTRP